jgi:hypothetical protein
MGEKVQKCKQTAVIVKSRMTQAGETGQRVDKQRRKKRPTSSRFCER